MSSVPVVIVGTIKDNDGTNEKQVTITGLASIQGLHVGGGPMPPPAYPAHPIAPGGPPPSVMPPIYYPPVSVMPPIYYPPGIWGPPGPWPTPPIYLPPGSGGGDGEPGREKKFECKTAWTPETGWIVVWVPAEGTLIPSPAAGPTPPKR